jgi:hypothetical protein
MPGVGEVEAGEVVGAVAGDADLERLQPLERGGNVEDRLDPGADDADAGARECDEVGGLVPGGACVAVHTAEPAGGEHGDPGLRGEVRGGGDGRRAGGAARHRDREVAGAALGDVVAGGDRLERGGVEADAHDAVEQRDRGRHRARLAHLRLDLARDLRVAGAWQPVRDQRRLERDDRPTAGQRIRDLWGDDEHCPATLATRLL